MGGNVTLRMGDPYVPEGKEGKLVVADGSLCFEESGECKPVLVVLFSLQKEDTEMLAERYWVALLDVWALGRASLDRVEESCKLEGGRPMLVLRPSKKNSGN